MRAVLESTLRELRSIRYGSDKTKQACAVDSVGARGYVLQPVMAE